MKETEIRMSEIVPGTTDAAVEKHVPVWTVEKRRPCQGRLRGASHAAGALHRVGISPDQAGQSAQGAASRRKAGDLLRPLRGR